MVAPNPAVILPQLVDLAQQGDKLSGQLGGLQGSLREIVGLLTPTAPEYVNSSSDALESSRVVKSGACRLYGFSGYNSNTSAQFILAFDTGTVPANGAVPVFVLKAPASDNFWVSWTPAFRQFHIGCVLANSSTEATLTIGAADCWFDAQYE